MENLWKFDSQLAISRKLSSIEFLAKNVIKFVQQLKCDSHKEKKRGRLRGREMWEDRMGRRAKVDERGDEDGTIEGRDERRKERREGEEKRVNGKEESRED